MIHESNFSLPVPHLGGVSLPLETVETSEKTDFFPKIWKPERAVFTPAALEWEHGRQIWERVEKLGIPVEKLKANRITGIKSDDVRATYKTAKTTLAVVVSPPSYLKLSPIPPSADWQFHLAEGCPAHCQYCYLAGSLSGPPVVRVFANLEEILSNLAHYEKNEPTSYEASCYTDPLGIEHLTGSLAASIRYFGTRQNGFLRWVSKFDAVDSLLDLPHKGQTRCRASVNAAPIARRLEGGTASLSARLAALRKLALPREQGGGAYPVGLVVAPIMPLENWRAEYSNLLDEAAKSLDFECDLTFELITHRFTPGSKDVLLQWYPNTQLDLDESKRSVKRNKFGGTKFVYGREQMKELKSWFYQEIERRFPAAKILYWT